MNRQKKSYAMSKKKCGAEMQRNKTCFCQMFHNAKIFEMGPKVVSNM